MSNKFKKILWPTNKDYKPSEKNVSKDLFKRSANKEYNKKTAKEMGKKGLKDMAILYGISVLILCLYFIFRNKISFLIKIDEAMGENAGTIIFFVILGVFSYIQFAKSNKS
jgi:hypothetical protein